MSGLSRQGFSIIAGTVLMIASFMFILLAYFLNLDFLIPVMMSIVSFLAALALFFMGYPENKQ